MNKTLAVVAGGRQQTFGFLSNKPYLVYWTSATTASLFLLGAYI